jgi:hypothetical protein
MRDTTSTLGAASVALLLARAAGAHPGHGLGGGSFDALHYLSEPLHVAPVALLALAAALAWRRLRRARDETR